MLLHRFANARNSVFFITKKWQTTTIDGFPSKFFPKEENLLFLLCQSRRLQQLCLDDHSIKFTWTLSGHCFKLDKVLRMMLFTTWQHKFVSLARIPTTVITNFYVFHDRWTRFPTKSRDLVEWSRSNYYFQRLKEYSPTNGRYKKKIRHAHRQIWRQLLKLEFQALRNT